MIAIVVISSKTHGSRNGCCFWKIGQRLVVVGAVDVAADSHRLCFFVVSGVVSRLVTSSFSLSSKKGFLT